MIRLIREIRDSGQANIVLSSHLLRDVEECCEEILILKTAISRCIAISRRSASRIGSFWCLETRGDDAKFVRRLPDWVASMRSQAITGSRLF
jgi:ABC-2 type transport system ATP-binding protein